MRRPYVDGNYEEGPCAFRNRLCIAASAWASVEPLIPNREVVRMHADVPPYADNARGTGSTARLEAVVLP
jgi:hypothetical protein